MNDGSRLIITHDSGKSEHYYCASSSCKSERCDYVYSYTHAGDIGWRFEKNDVLDTVSGYIAYCPKCMLVRKKLYRGHKYLTNNQKDSII